VKRSTLTAATYYIAPALLAIATCTGAVFILQRFVPEIDFSLAMLLSLLAGLTADTVARAYLRGVSREQKDE
jgi:hypothetical protein